MNYFEFMKFKKTTTTKGFYFKYMWNKLSLYLLKNKICTNQWQLSKKKKNEKKNTSQVNAYLNLTERGLSYSSIFINFKATTRN